MDKTHHRILLVEDDPEIVELITTLLQKNGFDVTSCLDGSQALDTFKKEEFSLVLLDLMLPGKDGYSICRELRAAEKDSRTPIILLSALAQKGEIEKGLDVGADVYITKPYENKHLLDQINTLLSRT